jgi:nucleoside-diphosphate-sugar epimerase
LQAQTNIVLLTATSNTTDTLLKTAKLKLALGKIGEEEYLQIQLEQLNTTAQLQQAQNDFELTKNIFSSFNLSDARVFIYISSVKAVLDSVNGPLTETHEQNPQTEFGKSKFLAEQYILSKDIPEGKRVYILRPCMIHGPGNKGNLNLLYELVSKGIPWPLGAFKNQRSFCSIDNLMFIFKELIERDDIPSGVYNVADDAPLSTNEVISILAESQNRKPRIWSISKPLIQFISKMGNLLKLPLNEERLQKLTDSYVVSNKKLMNAIGKPLPVSSREGLLRTFQSFQ